MPQRNVATNFTFEQQRQEINLLAADFWTQKGIVDTAASTYLKHDGSNDFTGQTLAVPNAFTINANSGAGTVTITGNLSVSGTTTTVNSANLEVTDKNILIAKGSTSDANSDGAGITIDSATDITFNFVDAKDALVSSIGLEGTTFLKAPYGQFTGNGTPGTGQGIEINAPDANTGQIISYDRGNTAYKELRLKGSSVGIYGGTSNALVGSFSSTGLSVTGAITGTTNLEIGGASSIFAENNLRFKSAGDAYIDHNTTGQDIQFRVSNSSSLDTTPLVVSSTGLKVTGNLGITASNGVNYLIENPSNDENFNISTYHDSDGLYTFIGSNAKLDASGNYAVDTTAHKATGIHLDARNNGYVAILTGVANDGLNERVRVQDDGKIKLGTGGDNVNPANVEIRYADPVLLIRDEAATSVTGNAKIAFGNESHYPVAYISHEWTAGEKGSLTFHTRSGGSESEKMRITDTGQVGINIDDNTTADLHVRTGNTGAGLFRLGGGTGGATGLDINYTNAGTTKTVIKQNYRSTNAAAELSLDSGFLTFMTGTLGTDERVRITADGNVGINETSPQGFLDVRSTTDLGSIFRRDYGGVVSNDSSKLAMTIWGQDHDQSVTGSTNTDKYGPMIGFGGRADDAVPNIADIRAGISYSYNGDLTFHAKAGSNNNKGITDGSHERLRIDGENGNLLIGSNNTASYHNAIVSVSASTSKLLELRNDDGTDTNYVKRWAHAFVRGTQEISTDILSLTNVSGNSHVCIEIKMYAVAATDNQAAIIKAYASAKRTGSDSGYTLDQQTPVIEKFVKGTGIAVGSLSWASNGAGGGTLEYNTNSNSNYTKYNCEVTVWAHDRMTITFP